jgi:hypothetical protein
MTTARQMMSAALSALIASTWCLASQLKNSLVIAPFPFLVQKY